MNFYECNSNDGCIIEQFLKTPFSRRTVEIKNILVKLERPQPDLQNLTKQCKTQGREVTRRFPVSIYQKHEWITGCNKLNKIFCWPCLFFLPNRDTIWLNPGYSDLNHLSAAVFNHEKTMSHLTAVLDMKTFGDVRIDLMLDSQLKHSVTTHNENVTKNRLVLRRLIDMTCFLGMQELSFRGHDETADSVNRGNFIEMMNVLAKYDSILSQHLNNAGQFRGTSPIIQNDLIESIAKLINPKYVIYC